MITLYDCSTAPSPRRARILLAAKGVPHDTVQVDLRSGEQMGDAFRAINPQCTVPALRLTTARPLGLAATATRRRRARASPPAPTTPPLCATSRAISRTDWGAWAAGEHVGQS